MFYQFEKGVLSLKSVKFWNMPYTDILEAKKVWEKTVNTIKLGRIVRDVTDLGARKTYFPKNLIIEYVTLDLMQKIKKTLSRFLIKINYLDLKNTQSIASG